MKNLGITLSILLEGMSVVGEKVWFGCIVIVKYVLHCEL